MGLDAGSGNLRVRAAATRPTDGRDYQRDRAPGVNRDFAKTQRAVHQHGHPAEADGECESEADGESLRPQKENFGEGHEDGDGRQHNRGNSRGHAPLRPEQQPVVQHEDQHR